MISQPPHPQHSPVRLLLILLVVLLFPLAGTLAFMFVEGWGFVDSLYMVEERRFGEPTWLRNVRCRRT